MQRVRVLQMRWLKKRNSEEKKFDDSASAQKAEIQADNEDVPASEDSTDASDRANMSVDEIIAWCRKHDGH